MKLILCVDDKGGLAFNHRRQSRDRVLNERILMHCGIHSLCIPQCIRMRSCAE